MQELECKGSCGSVIISMDDTRPCENSKNGYCCECRFSKFSKRFCNFCTMVWNESMEELREENYDEAYGYGSYKNMKLRKLLGGLIK